MSWIAILPLLLADPIESVQLAALLTHVSDSLTGTTRALRTVTSGLGLC